MNKGFVSFSGIFPFLMFFWCYAGFAQVSSLSSDSSHHQDIQQISEQNPVNELADRELKQSLANYEEHQVVLKQSKNFFLIKNEIEKARNFLKSDFQYHDIRDEITQLTNWKVLAIDGVITNRDSIPAVLNLTTTFRLLAELLNRTNKRLSQILTYHKSLGQLQSIIDSLAMDSVLYFVPKDSVARTTYYHKLLFLTRDIGPVNKKLKTALDSIQRLEMQVNLLKFSIESDISETESLQAKIFEQFNTNELGFFGQNHPSEGSVRNIFNYSLGKAKLVMFFYTVNHADRMIMMVLLITGLYLFLVMLKRKIKGGSPANGLVDSDRVIQYPLANSILVTLTIFQFFLPLPPFIFSGFIWLTSAVVLTWIIRHSVPPFWFYSWLVSILFFLLAFSSNLILRHSSFERWSMLLMSILGLAAGVLFLTSKHKKESPENVIPVSVIVMAFFQILAIYYNLTGGFNLAKIFMTNGLFTVIVAFLLLWTARFINGSFRIILHLFTGSEGKRSSFPDEKTLNEIPRFYYLLFLAGWFILIGRNTYYFQAMFEPFRESLTTTRTIGEFSFNYNSILIFFSVLFLSGVISKVVSFLASDTLTMSNKPKKSRFGSWLVLIRISIITAGVLVAFIAAGIPMDRFAIILGAMSVGIGFGLQTLVNNLISGLVIAFEKPVNVGDIVEFAGQTGRMKSIGIRSSVVTTWDGADVIIPNGDLLNQHLVNWTLGNSSRRFDLLLGVAYGTDLQKTQQLLLDMMMKDNRILKHPQPLVWANKFSSSSVELSLKFWVAHFDIGFDVRSDLIVTIDELFRENGIEIPFPRQDVHIRSGSTTPSV